MNNKILKYDQYLNEAMKTGSIELVNPSLNKAATIIARFVNKKTKKDFKKFPFEMITDMGSGVMFYSSKGTEAFMVTAAAAKNPGIVGSIIYFSDAANSKSDFSISSETFPIVKLVGEFVRLMDKKYVASIQESMLLERRTKRAFSKEELKMIEAKLAAGMAVNKIADELEVPYSSIMNIKKGQQVEVKPTAAETQNDMTLNDKVKYLEETMEDIYEISRRVAAGAFNSLFISGRAGTGKTYNVERAMKDEGLVDEEDYVMVSGAASVIMMYKKFYQYRNKTLIFDDCDAVFRDENGRNLMKAALDTKKVRKISYLKKTKAVYDPKDVSAEEAFNLEENGIVPNSFEFAGRVIFISNLAKEKADPDGAIRSRSILVDVNPDDATLMERMERLLPHLEPTEMPLKEKEEIYEFMKNANDISMRTFVKAAGLKMSGLPNWQRAATRYL